MGTERFAFQLFNHCFVVTQRSFSMQRLDDARVAMGSINKARGIRAFLLEASVGVVDRSSSRMGRHPGSVLAIVLVWDRGRGQLRVAD